MHLVEPDILAEVARLSPAAAGVGLLLGLAVWCTGWLRRTFWVALAVTAGFGLYGVHLGRATGSHPLVTALLLGVSAGLLSLELGRVIAFVAGGLAAALFLAHFVPTFPEPLLAYLAGGLLAVLLFKLCFLAVMGFSGALLMTYCGLALAMRSLRIDTIQLATARPNAMNTTVLVLTLLGMVVQSRLHTWVVTRDQRLKAKAMAVLDENERAAVQSAKPVALKPRMWGLLKPRKKVA
jgi:hypothetical protein